ncbi:hypothetical protein AK812_SmicGene16522 [Symbiodinium microadriaticum]|uniref:Uncharacterized protein n=1 Tax=Symbiodinium microadriaticum TaxID=2951 RepID=A0A1Q9E029_SYMMI|nr:hypothetical protein AK812_SmicGene16522 [Symbiodinium microadriaticum]
MLVPVARPARPEPSPTAQEEGDIFQPEQELTPQVSHNPDSNGPGNGVERDLAAPPIPSGSAAVTGVNDQTGSSGSFEATNEVSPAAAEVPIPDDDDDGLFTEEVLLASPAAGVTDADGQDLLTFTALHTSACASGPPLAEDDLPYVEQPLECQEDQAFCLEIPVKAKDIKRWSQEANPEHMVQLAAVSKRARAEVHVKGEYVKNIPQIDIGRPRRISPEATVTEESYKKLNLAIIVTDCKSLYDLVTRLAMPACEEHRTTLEVLLIKQRCAENTCFRWIPTTLQAADCLTKVMDATLLRTVLSQGRFKLFDTSKVLEKDAQRRQAIEWLAKPPASECR